MRKKVNISAELFGKNEVDANKALTKGCVAAAIILLIFWILFLTPVFAIRSVITINVIFPVCIVLLLTPLAFYNRPFLAKPGYKYFLLGLFTIAILLLNVLLPKHCLILWAALIIMANHFYTPKTVTFMFVVVIIFMFASIPLGMIEGEWDANLMGISEADFESYIVFGEGKERHFADSDSYADRLLWLNTFNDYYPSVTNRWFAAFAFYGLGRFACLLLVYLICVQLSLRTLKLVDSDAQMEMQQGKIVAELEVANEIQQSTLTTVFPNVKEYDVYASMEPAKSVGGDFYNFYQGKEHIVCTVADVSGKGVPAAMFMMRAKTLFRVLAANHTRPEDILSYINNDLCENNSSEMFVTANVASLNIKTGKVLFSNAGHNPPLIRHVNGKFEYMDVPPCFVLGAYKDIKFTTVEYQLQPGDTIFVYTDGITEATNKHNELYGENRLLKLLNSLYPNLTSQEICRLVLNDVKTFAKGVEQSDDITMFCLKYFGNQIKTESIILESEIANVQKAIDFIDKYLEAYNPDHKALMNLQIAIDEVFSNIVYYAYGKEKGYIIVRAHIDEDRNFTLQFADQGKPFNPLEKEDPDISLSADERKIGGLGIFMIKKTMDDVKYSYLQAEKANVLSIIKKV